jgi:hypothetical protein
MVVNICQKCRELRDPTPVPENQSRTSLRGHDIDVFSRDRRQRTAVSHDQPGTSHLRITCAPFTPIVDMDVNRRFNFNWRYGRLGEKLTGVGPKWYGSVNSRCPQNFNRELLRVAVTVARLNISTPARPAAN